MKWLWPKFTNADHARRVARNGAIVGGLSALFTTVSVTMGLVTPLVLIDALIFGVCSFGTYKMNRIAAGTMLTLYLVEMAFTYLKFGHISLVMAVFVSLFFANALRATLYFKQSSQERNTTSKAA